MINNIFLLITNLGIGGAQRVFAEQALILKKRYTVSEVVFNAGESEDIYKTGNPQFSLDTTAGKNILDKVLKIFRRADSLKRLIAAHNASLCISHMDGANWVNVLSRARVKKILVVHGTILHDYAINPRLRLIRQKWIIPLLYKKADKVVAVSEGIKNELTTFCGLKNVIAIPNAFDRVAILKKAEEPLSESWESVFAENRVMITSGRLHEQKSNVICCVC
jgi:glycosyltransferase involved in cell wall biosynthesis